MACATVVRDDIRVATVTAVAVVHGLPLVRTALSLSIAPKLANCRLFEAETLAGLTEQKSWRPAESLILVDQAEWTVNRHIFARDDAPVGLIGPAGPCPPLGLLRAMGVKGWTPIDAETERFVVMTQKLANGGEYFAAPPRPGLPGFGRLTERQIDVLALMASGLINKEIARRLGVRETTVKAHVASILIKLDCRRRTEAIGRFLQGFGGTPRGSASLASREPAPLNAR